MTRYPNPVRAQQLLTVEGMLPEAGQVRLQIYDMTGRLIKQEVTESITGYLSRTVSIAGLAKGTYQLSIASNEGKVWKTWMFVVQ